jgi:threonyl-tRNA synthetase
MWQKAEAALEAALKHVGLEYQVNPGDGAFYGPKIDFHIRDTLSRSWQCGTIQLDFSMPERFGLVYVGADGERHTPVMLHRACYGSLERFLGIIIENYAGAFPLWLSPVQVEVLPISDKYNDYASSLADKLRSEGLRVNLNLKDDRIGYKIREASLKKIPYCLILGEKEMESGTVNVRSRDKGELGEISLVDFLNSLENWKV